MGGGGADRGAWPGDGPAASTGERSPGCCGSFVARSRRVFRTPFDGPGGEPSSVPSAPPGRCGFRCPGCFDAGGEVGFASRRSRLRIECVEGLFGGFADVAGRRPRHRDRPAAVCRGWVGRSVAWGARRGRADSSAAASRRCPGTRPRPRASNDRVASRGTPFTCPLPPIASGRRPGPCPGRTPGAARGTVRCERRIRPRGDWSARPRRGTRPFGASAAGRCPPRVGHGERAHRRPSTPRGRTGPARRDRRGLGSADTPRNRKFR